MERLPDSTLSGRAAFNVDGGWEMHQAAALFSLGLGSGGLSYVGRGYHHRSPGSELAAATGPSAFARFQADLLLAQNSRQIFPK